MGTSTHHLFPLFVFLTSVAFLNTQSIGWRMIDRYYGFRFEIDAVLGKDFDEMVRSYAESKACFGWIQKASEDKWVYQLYSSNSRRKASKFLSCISSVGGRGEM